jgi:hypothetical protein
MLPVLPLLEAKLRSAVRRWMGDQAGQAELFVVLLLAFLIWVLATNRRVVIQ